MTGLIIHPEVIEELAEAANWYRAIDSELGERFLSEVYQGIRKAQETPLHYRMIGNPYRRILCESFPYRIVFEVIEEMQSVHIVAVTHQMRHPDQWKKRL
ncbi:MAG: type II toxin-antitoxin system RelE/ParE family toxin [Verrucomicrobia bacterium]|jgi:plasmid stabilization system protein ParE|nr:type II toxin-antitoxin system RelE/ParE family toxin [Verrucomicrobiota bacterium]